MTADSFYTSGHNPYIAGCTILHQTYVAEIKSENVPRVHWSFSRLMFVTKHRQGSGSAGVSMVYSAERVFLPHYTSHWVHWRGDTGWDKYTD